MVLAAVISSVLLSAEVDPSKQLDFWVGEWQLTGRMRNAPGKEEYTETKAKNVIARVQGGKVVQETFESDGFTGSSWSVYDVRKKKWFQTWVDNSGAYLTFEGEATKEGFMFVQNNIPAEVSAKGTRMRMVFSKITADGFHWDWQSSGDSGKSWETQWELDYKRVKKAAGG